MGIKLAIKDKYIIKIQNLNYTYLVINLYKKLVVVFFLRVLK